MSTLTKKKTSKIKDSNAFVVRVNLEKMLSTDELTSFANEAKKHGRSIREHFLAITIGDKKSA